MRTLLLLALIAALFGCARGSHIITGQARPPIPVTSVKIYTTLPAQYETIGIVNSHSPGELQGAMDDCVANLKKHAAEIGANGIILSATQQTSGQLIVVGGVVSTVGGGTSISATAIYVP